MVLDDLVLAALVLAMNLVPVMAVVPVPMPVVPMLAIVIVA